MIQVMKKKVITNTVSKKTDLRVLSACLQKAVNSRSECTIKMTLHHILSLLFSFAPLKN